MIRTLTYRLDGRTYSVRFVDKNFLEMLDWLIVNVPKATHFRIVSVNNRR
jgi:hypothetical protein